MQSYSVKGGSSQPVQLYLAGLSIVAAWLVWVLLRELRLSVPWWIDAPSVMGFYALLYQVFDKWLWRTWLSRSLGWSVVPNLTGIWYGQLKSSYGEGGTPIDAIAEIHQTWTHIRVDFKTQLSRSASQIAAIECVSPNRAVLFYEYLSEPRAGAVASMQAHRGAARLEYQLQGNNAILEGEYYSGRGRQNVGTLHLTRRPD